MIYELQITTASANRLSEAISQRFRWIREQGFSVAVTMKGQKARDMEVLSACLQGHRSNPVFRDEDIVYIFKHQLSEMISEHILNDWEARLVWKEIYKSCRILSQDERQTIYNKATRFLRRCNDNESLNLLMNYGRKNRIAHRILEHIQHHDLMDIEGFIIFCLQDYLTEIRFSVELAMEELKNEKEYNDFVTLLRYFVDSQTPKIFEVNVMMDEDGVFYLWDGNGVKIEEKYMSYYLDDMLMNEINFDDILISILITIAPRRIVLHNALDLGSEPVETIKKVFKEKIRMCSGCERCHHYMNKSTRP